MKTFVKFCGLRTEAEVAAVADGGAAGFVIEVPASPRNISAEQAAALLDRLPAEAEAWAVVVDPSLGLLRRLYDEVGVDRIQVYGRIPDGLEDLERHRLVPSVAIRPDGADGELPSLPPPEEHPRVHLDAAGQPVPGGSGVRPNWEVCARLVDAHAGRKFVLGGGLSPQNVGDALASVRPWGVDVSSGVERAPGVKDLGKMAAFLAAVESYEERHG